jgi:calpain-15
MRNPWKEGEWSGAFGDGSEEMTEELMAELEHSHADDGLFWMKYEDMLKTFEQVDIAKVNDDYYYSFI